ncbi:hypothetical protein FACUT_9267 [Fusarium acutatum]|uniref:Uncharacterized protein n=1 Tax=Fusarium acutatum TaxID=78861 RepID=A0A8H4JIC5_9HYPO|nr:hypothetical protein FACUT_9267 [Fusarium acutatum]
MAETTLCYLLQTLHEGVVQVRQQRVHEALSAATHHALENHMLMSSIKQIVRNALRQASYPEFGGTGCNWKNDTGQSFHVDLSLPIRCSRDRQGGFGAFTSFVSKYENIDNGKQKVHGCNISQALGHLPGIQKGKPLIFSFELMEDGNPHPTPWYRGPVHGAWSNCHELHSFAIKVEWKNETNNQWYCYPLQPIDIFSTYVHTDGDSTVTREWRKATSILQFLHNSRYRNPPSFLHGSFRPDIKHVVYDHLTQNVGFKQVPETVMDPPSHVSSDHNIRALGKASETYWPLIKFGRMPDISWFGFQRGIPEKMVRESYSGNVMPPPGYEGLSLREWYNGPAIPIEAPMSLKMYKEFEKDVKNIEAVEAAQSRVDDE